MDAGGRPTIATGSLASSVRSIFTRTPPSTLLADLAPQLLPHIAASPHFVLPTAVRAPVVSLGANSNLLRIRLGWSGIPRGHSADLYIMEKVEELCGMEIPAAPFDLNVPYNIAVLLTPSSTAIDPVTGVVREDPPQVPLIRGFLATTPAADSARLERRRQRAKIGETGLGLEAGGRLGLQQRETAARGMLAPGGNGDSADSPSRHRERRKKSSSEAKHESALAERSAEELAQEGAAVEQDMANVVVRRALLNRQIVEVDQKMSALDAIRRDLQRSLLGLREEELQLEDERQGIQERITIQEDKVKGRSPVAGTSRRRKGPAFLPSEHDELPSSVAFMSLNGHLAPITSLDFSQPYGVAVTASLDESVRLWDLQTGDEIGFLRGHAGAVKALQVEGSVCITGGVDGSIKVWDLDLAEAGLAPLSSPSIDTVTRSLEDVLLGTSDGGAGLVNGKEEEGMMREESAAPKIERNDGCVKTILAHTKPITSLYFDGDCLVTGSSDRTLRQFDLTTGQCVLTMDILWAISNPLASQTLSSDDSFDEIYSETNMPRSSPRKSLGTLRRSNSNFLPAQIAKGFSSTPVTTTYADGSFGMFDDFVGGVQFWGYALVSGSADGAVRMWDMRIGQAHRTLIGHTGPITSVQFDEFHLVSASLDKSIRIWDLRTGSISDTIRYENPVTALQFDSRKIVAAAGENPVRVFNRTTLQHSSLSVNGHTAPLEKLRFMDSYLMTGGRDSAVKVWALP